MPHIKRTRQSRADMVAIHSFISDQSPQNADMLFLAFEEKIQMLASSKFIGKPRPELGVQIRSWIVHRFVLFYRPTDDGIELIRILHGSMDMVPGYFV